MIEMTCVTRQCEPFTGPKMLRHESQSHSSLMKASNQRRHTQCVKLKILTWFYLNHVRRWTYSFYKTEITFFFSSFKNGNTSFTGEESDAKSLSCTHVGVCLSSGLSSQRDYPSWKKRGGGVCKTCLCWICQDFSSYNRWYERCCRILRSEWTRLLLLMSQQSNCKGCWLSHEEMSVHASCRLNGLWCYLLNPEMFMNTSSHSGGSVISIWINAFVKQKAN